jgi:hypothetical protein
MPERDPSSDSSSFSKPSIGKLEAIIRMLSILIGIAKYLPWIVLAFAGINLTLAVLYFAWWNNIAWGIFNSILAFAGILFFGQLVRRRKTHRYRYRYAKRSLRIIRKINEKEEAYAERQDSNFKPDI